MLAQLARRDGEYFARQDRDHDDHRRADPPGRLRETVAGNQEDPQRRKHDAAHAGAVVGHAERGRAPFDEPGRDQRIDRRRAQRHPAHAGEQRGRVQL
ncbi:hypothetical protein, partial [Achromobacter xylosoxidans]|uniref:hypothetical protein n=1 Tax=Alcaligenes xylosoxydans xylosoxydans TaxID=85698 RepID=UPI001E589993